MIRVIPHILCIETEHKEWVEGCHRQHYNIYDEPTGCPHSCGKWKTRTSVRYQTVYSYPTPTFQPTDLNDFDF